MHSYIGITCWLFKPTKKAEAITTPKLLYKCIIYNLTKETKPVNPVRNSAISHIKQPLCGELPTANFYKIKQLICEFLTGSTINYMAILPPVISVKIKLPR